MTITVPIGNETSYDSFIVKLRNVIRHGLVVETILGIASRLGLDVSAYYLYREDPYDENFRPPVPDLKGIETKFIGPEEFEQIGQASGDRNAQEYLLDVYRRGMQCFGLFSEGEVIAYICVNSENPSFLGHEISMDPEEVYLFGIYTMRKWRGRNAATTMRYELTKKLAEMNKTKYCTIISYFNTPSIRHKAKSHPRRYQLYLHLGLFKMWERQWLLKSYGDQTT